MSLNDKDVTLGGARGIDVHPGVANPTAHSDMSDPLAANFVHDPTTDDIGAGAAANFEGDRQASRNFSKTAGVVEGRPGIIETTNIDPLNENSNKDDGWANTTSGPSNQTTNPSLASTAATYAGGIANLAYGHAMGDEKAKQAGMDALGYSKKE